MLSGMSQRTQPASTPFGTAATDSIDDPFVVEKLRGPYSSLRSALCVESGLSSAHEQQL